jgi:hypothetical protein
LGMRDSIASNALRLLTSSAPNKSFVPYSK